VGKFRQNGTLREHVHFAPNFSAHSSISGSPQLRIGSMMCMSFSPSVVKPVIVLPAITDFPVAGSMTPGKIAPPWQLRGECYPDY
jgi:hypothetical protein